MTIMASLPNGVLFRTVPPLPTYVYNRTISVNTSNFNLRNDIISSGWDQVSPLSVSVTINSGIYVWATSVTVAAFDTDVLPAGVNVNIYNNGIIMGCGGNGGYAGAFSSKGDPGLPGACALRSYCNVTLVNNGYILGGGGGGGSVNISVSGAAQTSYCGAGGGGAGGGNGGGVGIGGGGYGGTVAAVGTVGYPSASVSYTVSSGTNASSAPFACGGGGGRIYNGSAAVTTNVQRLPGWFSRALGGNGGGASGGGGATNNGFLLAGLYYVFNSPGGAVTTAAGGGGGGWGASGSIANVGGGFINNGGSYAGGAGGPSIEKHGKTMTISGTGTVSGSILV